MVAFAITHPLVKFKLLDLINLSQKGAAVLLLSFSEQKMLDI